MRVYDEMQLLIQEAVNENISEDIVTIGEAICESMDFEENINDIKLEIYERENAGVITEAEKISLLEMVEQRRDALESLVCEYTYDKRIDILKGTVEEFKKALEDEEGKDKKDIAKINTLKKRIQDAISKIAKLEIEKDREDSRPTASGRVRSSAMSLNRNQSRSRFAYA